MRKYIVSLWLGGCLRIMVAAHFGSERPCSRIFSRLEPRKRFGNSIGLKTHGRAFPLRLEGTVELQDIVRHAQQRPLALHFLQAA